MTLELEVPEGLTPGQRDALIKHVKHEAFVAVSDFMNNEVNPDGCWCLGLDHRSDCRHWRLPY